MHFEPAVNTKREMTINLPNLFWQKYLSESAENGRPGRKNFGGPPSILGLRRRRADRYADKNPDEVLSKGWTLWTVLITSDEYLESVKIWKSQKSRLIV